MEVFGDVTRVLVPYRFGRKSVRWRGDSVRETGATVSTHTFFVAQHGRRHGAGVEAVIVGGHEGRRRTSATGGYKLGGTGRSRGVDTSWGILFTVAVGRSLYTRPRCRERRKQGSLKVRVGDKIIR